jgi:hypothetical protein
VNPHEPTDYPPGSPAKLEVLAERLRLGLPLSHPLDAGHGRAGPPGLPPHQVPPPTAPAVRKSPRRQEVVRRPQVRPRTPSEAEVRMVELYQGGHSIRAVAALTGYSPTGVRTALRRQGVACRPRSRRTGPDGPGRMTWPPGQG